MWKVFLPPVSPGSGSGGECRSVSSMLAAIITGVVVACAGPGQPCVPGSGERSNELARGGAGGAGGQGPDQERVDDAPSGLPATYDPFARESGVNSDYPIQSPDGRWRATVPADSRILKKEAALMVIGLPIWNTNVRIECQVHYRPFDIAKAFDHVKRTRARKASLVRIAPWAARVVADSPAIWIEAVYRTQLPDGEIPGHLKLALLWRRDHPILCIHDEAGFKGTFERATQAFFQSFQPTQPSPPPRYFEVHIARHVDVPVGFTVLALNNDQKPGHVRWEVSSVLMLSRSATELLVRESSKVQVSDSRQRLISGEFEEKSAGKISTKVAFERVKGPLYRYHGALQEKTVQGEFRTKSPEGLPSDLATAGALKRRLNQSKAGEFRQEEYFPSLNPAAPLEVVYSFDAQIGPTSRCGCAPGDLQCNIACSRLAMTPGTAATGTAMPLASGEFRPQRPPKRPVRPGSPPMARNARVKFGSMENRVTIDGEGLFSEVRFAIQNVQIWQRRELTKGSLVDPNQALTQGAPIWP
jgi:hypothetical protein